MNRNLDPDALLALLCAVARQWARDAQRDPHELDLLASWLGMEPAALADQLTGKANNVTQ